MAETDEELVQTDEFAEDKPQKGKKHKKILTPEEEKTKKRKSAFRLARLIILAVLLALIYMLVNNTNGFRDKTATKLKNVPIIKNFVKTEEQDEYASLSKDELIQENRNIKQENTQLKEENQTLNSTVVSLNEDMKRLKEIESQQLAFKEQKKAFDELVASQDEKNFQSFYEQMYPDNANEIYERIVKSNQQSKEAKQYIQVFETMKKESCAKILEELIPTDMDLVINILDNLSTEKKSDILSSMSVENAAACAKRMSK